MPRSVLYDRANERSGGSEVTKTEKHIVGEHESGWIFTSEVPLEEAPSTVSVTGSTGDWTEVTDGTPATKEYDVAYDIATPESRGGAIKFNATDDGQAVTVVYEGRGTKPFAGMFNDLQDSVGQWNINMRKAVVDTPDDEFNSSTHFAAGWTAVTGSAGAISLVGSGSTGAAGIYQLHPEQSLLLAQISNGKNVYLKRAFTLATGNSIVAKVIPAHPWGVSDVAQVGIQAVIALNGSTSSPEPGSAPSIHVGVQLIDDGSQTPNDGLRVFARNDGTATTVANTYRVMPAGMPYYFRIARSSTVYYFFYSNDGIGWLSMASAALASAPSQLWLAFKSAAAMSNPQPIIAVDWVRQGGNGVFPW
jgi:hypothetical protein